MDMAKTTTPAHRHRRTMPKGYFDRPQNHTPENGLQTYALCFLDRVRKWYLDFANPIFNLIYRVKGKISSHLPLHLTMDTHSPTSLFSGFPHPSSQWKRIPFFQTLVSIFDVEV